MRVLLLIWTALALSGCGGSPMTVESRTADRSQLTAQQLRIIELNNCVSGESERCERGGDGG
jgi:hypothetical protein